MPPVAPPATAPARVETSQPAATTRPTPGTAIRQARGTADRGTYSHPGSDRFAVVLAVKIAIRKGLGCAFGRVPVVGVAGDDADVGEDTP